MSLEIRITKPNKKSLNKAALKQRSLSKEGFNTFFKALPAGCLWKFAQPGPTKTLNKAALKQRSLSTKGFNSTFSNAFFARSLWKFA